LPDILPERYILYAGTISQRKGAYTLAKAAGEIFDEFSDVNLVYAGKTADENTEAQLRTLIGHQHDKRVHFVGLVSRDTVLAMMSKAEVFAFPSTLETFGLVIAEAMLQGAPTICCDVGPCPEFVENNISGILVPPDDPKEVARAVRKVLSDREFADRLAANGKSEIIKRFSLGKACEENIRLYDIILKEQSSERQ